MPRLLLIVCLLLFSEANAESLEQPMQFSMMDSQEICGNCTLVLAEGNIENDTAILFMDFVQENRLPTSTGIVFNSNGGSLKGGLELGRVIRSRHFRTSILSLGKAAATPRCASACAYAFLGGVVRTKDPESMYGVHQFASDYLFDNALSDAQVVSAILSNYIRDMGVSTELLEFASVTPAEEISWISEADLHLLNVITKSGSRLNPTWVLTRGKRRTSSVVQVEGIQSNDTVVSIIIGCPPVSGSSEYWLSILFENGVPTTTDITSRLSADTPMLPFEQKQHLMALSAASALIENSSGETYLLFRKAAKAHGFRQSDFGILGIPNYSVRMALTPHDIELLTGVDSLENSIAFEFDQTAFGLNRVQFPTLGLHDAMSEFLFDCPPE